MTETVGAETIYGSRCDRPSLHASSLAASVKEVGEGKLKRLVGDQLPIRCADGFAFRLDRHVVFFKPSLIVGTSDVWIGENLLIGFQIFEQLRAVECQIFSAGSRI